MKKRLLERMMSMAMACMVTVSGLPITTMAAETDTTFTDANDSVTAIDGMIYGTINMPYADFYYGELNDTTASTLTTPELTRDLVTESGMRNAGEYDVVSSATTSKSKRFATTYFADTETGVDIYGLTNVPIAIPVELYNNILAAKAANTTCNNNLYSFVESLTPSDTAFTEYKVLNADGTFSKMVSDVAVDEDSTASITTSSVWGDYQISIANATVDCDTMLGAVLETSDGEKYGMLHLENLWLNTTEMSFCVQPFTEPHGNSVAYDRHSDIQGKTITQITYLMENAADIVIDTDLLVKKQAGESTITATDATYDATNNMSTSFTFNTPADSAYTLASVVSGSTILAPSVYSYENGVLTFDSSLRPGAYKVTFSDAGYEDLTATFNVLSPLKAEDINVINNVLTITGTDATLAEYLSAITAVSVDGKALSGSSFGTAIFNEDGSINFDAAISFHGNKQVVFADGINGNYTLSITAAGYPSLEVKVGADQVAQHEHSWSSEYVYKKATLTANGSMARKCTDCGEVEITSTIYKASKLSLSTTSYTCNGKTKKPSVVVKDSKGNTISSKYYTLTYSNASSKNPGRYSVKITFKTRYSGSKTLYYTINPAKTTSKLSASTKTGFKVTWAKITGVSGYQIQYSTSSKFTASKTKTVTAAKSATSKKISKLTPNKKYYVRIRAYKTYTKDGKSAKLYASWSTAKAVKTTK